MAAAGNIFVSLGMIVAWMVLLGARRIFRGTTLVTAEVWSYLAAIAWTSTWIVDHCLHLLSAALADYLWYGCAILTLCPPIAVLGSRRPGVRVWTWFILLPMLLALCWPIGALWFHGSELRRLQIETPQLIAVCLVLVMGVGNYCGTTYTLSALLYGSAILALVTSSAAKFSDWLAYRDATRLWCTVAVTLAIVLLRTSRRPTAITRFDRLWYNFFDTFGIVWGRRIQDRVNYIATSERLPVRLELHGFVWSNETTSQSESLDRPPDNGVTDDVREKRSPHSSAADSPKTSTKVEARVDHILRWLLRRFVDSPWIDERLGAKTTAIAQDLAVDS